MYGIVIADDELMIRKGLMSIPWNDYDIQVLGVAEDGHQALTLLKTQCPEILLTDIRMPGIDGLKLIEAAKAENPEIQSILLTGYEDFNYAREAIRLGAVGYILKPSDPDEIIESVNKAKRNLDNYGRNNSNHLKTTTIRNKAIGKLFDYMEKHYAEEITLYTAAEYVHMNHIYVSRLFKKEIGKTFLDVLTTIRLQKACELLADNDNKIYEIAEKVGIYDSGYFSQVFKKYYDMTPSEYRDKLFSKGMNGERK
jgi:two-component system response regulator YesN